MQTNTYSPSWTGTGGNPVLGSGGSVTGKYIRLHPGMVYGYAKINTGGSGFSAGGGTYRLTLPVAMRAEIDSFPVNPAIGKSYFLDASAALTSTDMTVLYDPGVGRMFFRRQDGDSWTATAPVVPAQGDKMVVYFAYPTSVA